MLKWHMWKFYHLHKIFYTLKITKIEYLKFSYLKKHYLLLFLISIVLALATPGFRTLNDKIDILWHQVFSLLAIPFLFIISSAFLVILKEKYLKYFPSFVYASYCLSAFLTYITDSEETNFILYPIVTNLWIIIIPITVVLIIIARTKSINNKL
jgi:hypothetical protein